MYPNTKVNVGKSKEKQILRNRTAMENETLVRAQEKLALGMKTIREDIAPQEYAEIFEGH